MYQTSSSSEVGSSGDRMKSYPISMPKQKRGPLRQAREELKSRVEFLKGFAHATKLSTTIAKARWNKFSSKISGKQKAIIECGGYEAGRAEGLKFAKLFPPGEPQKSTGPSALWSLGLRGTRSTVR